MTRNSLLMCRTRVSRTQWNTFEIFTWPKPLSNFVKLGEMSLTNHLVLSIAKTQTYYSSKSMTTQNERWDLWLLFQRRRRLRHKLNISPPLGLVWYTNTKHSRKKIQSLKESIAELYSLRISFADNRRYVTALKIENEDATQILSHGATVHISFDTNNCWPPARRFSVTYNNPWRLMVGLSNAYISSPP